MRQTNCLIDQAGNLWALNNWKPRFDVDIAPRVGNPAHGLRGGALRR
jgi:hypothetical protein